MVDRTASVLGAIVKNYGKNVAGGGEALAGKRIRVPIGALSLDIGLGGGLPVGTTTLLYGEKGAGKTTTALRAAGAFQGLCRTCFRPAVIQEVIPPEGDPDGRWTARGYCSCVADGLSPMPPLPDRIKAEDGKKFAESVGDYRDRCAEFVETMRDNSFIETIALWLDVENGSFDPEWAFRHGVDPRRLMLIKPTTAEEAADIARAFALAGVVDFMVIDSIAQLTPSKEVEESVSGDARVVVRKKDCFGNITLAELHSRWEQGERGFEIRGYDIEKGIFGWHILNNVWKLPGKELVEIKTKYGRSIKVTPDHSIFLVHKTGRFCDDMKRHRYLWNCAVKEARGGDVRVGDYMLLEKSVDFSESEIEIDLLKSFRLTGYAGGLDREFSISKSKLHSKSKSSCSYIGVHGCFAPVRLCDSSDIPMNAFLYSRGTHLGMQRMIPVDSVSYLAGFFAGDGWVSGNSIVFCCSPKDIKKVAKCVIGLGAYGDIGFNISKRKESNSYLVWLSCTPLVDLFKHWFGGARAPDKRIPSCVFSWAKDDKRRFIEGLIQSDGHRRFEGGFKITIGSSSKGMIDDLVELLKAFGIVSGKKNFHSYGGKIGKQIIKPSVSWSASWSGWSWYGGDGGKRGSGKSSMVGVGGLPVRVVSVKRVPQEEVFDLEVEGVSTFVANGLLVHNSMEKWQQGLAARVNNKMIRSLVVGAAQTKRAGGHGLTSIYINQIRMKIGVMFGDPTTIPGGMGQEFAAKIEIRFLGSKSEMEATQFGTKDEVIHTPTREKVRFKVTKNNTASMGVYDGSYLLVSRPDDRYEIGDIDDDELYYNLATYYLVTKEKNEGYVIFDKSFKTQDELRKALIMDRELRGEVRDYLFRRIVWGKK